MAFFNAGTFTFKGQSITLTAGETLSQVASAFNNASTLTGVSASIVKTASGTGTNSYKLVLTGNNSGLANDFNIATDATDASGVLSNLTFDVKQQAQNAIFKYNGVSVQRDTNTVSDLVAGVTFNLLQDTSSQPTSSFSITVAPDTSSISNGITNFVNAYNNFLSFYAKQTQIDSDTGNPTKDAVLYSDTTLQTVYSQLSYQTASIVNGLGTNASKTLSDIGISFTDIAATSTTPATANVLSIDSTILQNALTNNLSGVQNVFGYNATSSSTNLAVYSAPSDATIQNFTINVDQTTNAYTASYTDGQGVVQNITLTKSVLGSSNAISLAAPDSSGLKGLVLIYGGGGNESGITVSNTNGIAAQVNTFLATTTDKTSGLIKTAQDAIKTKNTTTQTQITAINDQITKTRQQLLDKFSALESAISSANSSLNYLNAQQLAKS